MSYYKIYELFRNLPDDAQRFGRGKYKDDIGTYCAVSSAIPCLQSPKSGMINTGQIFNVAAATPQVCNEAVELGVNIRELESLQRVNDTFEGTYRERFEHVMKWLANLCEWTGKEDK